MSKIPNPDQAYINVAKIRDYLLAREHPVGRFKCAFFKRLGYEANEWRRLENDILALLRYADAVMGERTEYGQKYVCEGAFFSPNGRNFSLRTIWIIRNSENFPRFISAVPGDRP